MSNLPYTHTSEKLNNAVTEIMNDYKKLVQKAKSYGLDIKYAPNATNMLELYFHDDYPDMILVDKEISCKLMEEIDSIIFETYDNAKDTLKKMDEIRQWYGVVTVQDLYDLCGLNSHYRDSRYGWITLEDAEIIECRDGYELKLPGALPIR